MEVAVRRSALIAAILVAGLLFAYLLLTSPPAPAHQTSAESAPTPSPPSPMPAPPPPLPDPVHPPPPQLPDRGANGRPVEVEPGRELRRQGLLDREPQPPADATTWEKRRLDTHQHWADETHRIAALWLEGRNEADRREVLGALSRFTTQVNTNRAQIAAGDLRPGQGREQLKQLKATVDQQVRAVLGDDTDALRAHLAEHLLGGGW